MSKPKKYPKLEECLSQEIKSAVNAYLTSKAMAITTREKVNAIYKEILTECPIYSDPKYGEPEQIFDPQQFYRCKDDALVQDAWDEFDKRARADGIKPASMPDDHCPALVAEHLQVQAENLLIEVAGKPWGITVDRLLRLDDRQEFIDLVCRLVVSQPDFKNPLTGKKA